MHADSARRAATYLPSADSRAKDSRLMQNTEMITEVPLGLVELDDAGTVLYYNRDGGPAACTPAHEMVGRNFYTDVAPVAEALEFRNTLAAFRRAHAPSHSFNFT